MNRDSSKSRGAFGGVLDNLLEGSGVFQALAGSVVIGWLFGIPELSETPRRSRVVRWIQRLLDALHRLLHRPVYLVGEWIQQSALIALAANGYTMLLRWCHHSLVGRLADWWYGDDDAAEGAARDNAREVLRNGVTRYMAYVALAYVGVDFLVRHYFPSVASVWDELFLIGFVIWVFALVVGRLAGSRGPGTLLAFVAYAAILLFLIPVSRNYSMAVESARMFLQPLLWFFIASNLRFDKRTFRALLDVFVLIMLILALHGIYQYVIGVEIPETWVDRAETAVRTRVFSVVGSPNVLGALMVLGASVTGGLFMNSRSWLKKAVYGLALAPLGLTLVFTFSRGAWLALALTVVLLGWWTDRRLIFVFAAAGLVAWFTVPSVQTRITYMLSETYLLSSASAGRLDRWLMALQYWQANALYGLGLGRFGGGVAIKYFPDVAYSVDNYFLKLGVQAGVLGLGAFLVLILTLFRQARARLGALSSRERAAGLGVLAGVVGVLSQGFVENILDFPEMAMYFWFLLGLIFAYTASEGARYENY